MKLLTKLLGILLDYIPEDILKSIGWSKSDLPLTKEIWDTYVNSVLPLDNPKHKIITLILDNQFTYHDTQYKANSQFMSPVALDWKIIIRLVIATIDKSKLFDEVSIQPMQGPVALAYANGNSIAVEAMTRKLKARWVIEAMQDIHELHGFDITSELINMISDELANEYDQLIDKVAVFCPYVMIVPTAPITNMNTFQPEIQLMTRYGLVGVETAKLDA